MNCINKLYVGVIVAAVLLVGIGAAAFAGNPYVFNSCWSWENLVCNDSKVLACPDGDGTYIFVSLRDSQGNGCPNVRVVATFTTKCDTAFCPGSVTAKTDGNGQATLQIRAGLDLSGNRGCCQVTTKVSCSYFDILHCATADCPGGCMTQYSTSTKYWLCPDYNADLEVNSTDFTFFGSDWGSSACRSDFNCDGTVDASDQAIFSLHYLDECP
jgi:hypothetical protein